MVYILLMIVFLIMVAFFTSSEIALISANRARLRTLGKKGNRGASFASEFLKRPDRFLSTILVGTNVAIVALTVVASRFLILSYGKAGEVLSTFIVTFLVLVLGEVIPKSMARKIPEVLTTVVARPLDLLHYLFLPAVFFVNSVSKGVLLLLGRGRLKEDSSFTRVEFVTAVREGERAGVLTTTEREIISGIFAFSRKRVEDVMVPRPKICAGAIEATRSDLVSLVSESRHSRIPIYERDLDHIVGLIHVMDLILSDTWDIRKIMRPVKSVHRSKACESLLDELRKEFSHLAIVTDGQGRTLGLVTLEDLVEIMVGEIRDEHDYPLVTT